MSDVTSFVWGNQPEPITQGFGVNLPTVPDDWYAYSADWGLHYGDHAGLDVGVPKLTPIYSLTSGVVSDESGFSPYFRPNPVHILTDDDPTIAGDDRKEIIYGHLWEDTVHPGDHVTAGQLLGYSGEQTVSGTMTPDGSGPHLHLEIRDLARHIVLDPTPFLGGNVPIGAGGVTTLPNTGSGSSSLAGLGKIITDLLPRVGLAVLGIVLFALGAFLAFPAVRDLTPVGRAINVAGKLKAATH